MILAISNRSSVNFNLNHGNGRFTQDERILDAFKLAVNQTMREIESEIKTRVRQNGANENRTTGNMVWAEFFHFTARPVNGAPT